MSRLGDGHYVWSDACNFTETMTTKQWREFLLEHGNRHFVAGRLRTFRARNLGAGVVEIYKVPFIAEERGN